MKNMMTMHELCLNATPVHRLCLKLAEIKDLAASGKRTTLYHPSPSRHVTPFGDVYTMLHFIDDSAFEALVIVDEKLVFSHFFQAGNQKYPSFTTTYKPDEWEEALDHIIASHHPGQAERLLGAGMSVFCGIASFAKGTLKGILRGRAA